MVITSDHGLINPASLNRQVIDQRIADFRATLRRDSKDAMAHYGLGLAYFNLQLWEEAGEELKLAAKLMPENAHIQYQYAVVLVDLAERGHNRSWAEAQERLDRALRLRPDYVEALLLKGRLANQTGDSSEAFTCWSAAYEADPERAKAPYTDGLTTRAKTYLARNNPADAINTFRQLATIDDGIAREQLQRFLNEYSRFVPSKIMTSQGKRGKLDWVKYLRCVGAAFGALLVWAVVMLAITALFAAAGKDNTTFEVIDIILILAYFAGWLAVPIFTFFFVWRRTPTKVHDASIPAQFVRRREILNGETSTPVMLMAAGEVASRLARDSRASSGEPVVSPNISLRHG